ncbi:MAG: class I SAM-dependent RNA methyltransferase, partial [Bacteroidota bacterium]
GPFINPMCGSGTLAIEAALIATNRTPGLLRSQYAFMHLQGYDPAFYTAERKQLEGLIKKPVGLKIVATDISSAAVSTAKTNAEAAGVAHLIEFATCDFERTTIPEATNGVVMLNPEYGERLGVEAELELVYARIGDFFKNKCRGYKGYIFTGNLELAKKIRLKTSRRIEFFNATIDCRLLEYELYAGTKRDLTGEGKEEKREEG